MDKLELLERIKGETPDRNGQVKIDDSWGDLDELKRFMEELHEDGMLKYYRAYISPPFWLVRV